MKLGLENKKQTMWAAVLGVIAVLAVAYEFIPMLTGPSSSPTTSAQAAAPTPSRVPARSTGKAAKRVPQENLDPTLHLDLLAAVERTQYEGSGRNIFVSQAEVVIPKPGAPGVTDAAKPQIYTPPQIQQPLPIPLKFFGFASKPGEPKKIFLMSQGEELFVAGEGEIVNRRYKVVRISPNSVEIQDMVNSGPPQNVPLTQG